jgi:DNA-binding NarL/FixJ family response regulator
VKPFEVILPAANGTREPAKRLDEPCNAQKAFEDALVRLDAACPESVDDEDSAELLRSLLTGHWFTITQFERNGRRYHLVHTDDPEVQGDYALTPRERQVLGYAELGQSNKLIAYSLGLSTSTVSTLLERARKKVSSAPPPNPEPDE